MGEANNRNEENFTYAVFERCIRRIAEISNQIHDGWRLQTNRTRQSDNCCYLTKTESHSLDKTSGDDTIIVIFEYHICYSPSYSVPIFGFIAWKQDGSLLHMEEYCQYNKKFAECDILSTLTQLDHPVLCKPFLTLHPCKTGDILDGFPNSKNVVISWLTTIAPYLNLEIHEEYIKAL